MPQEFTELLSLHVHLSKCFQFITSTVHSVTKNATPLACSNYDKLVFMFRRYVEQSKDMFTFPLYLNSRIDRTHHFTSSIPGIVVSPSFFRDTCNFLSSVVLVL